MCHAVRHIDSANLASQLPMQCYIWVVNNDFYVMFGKQGFNDMASCGMSDTTGLHVERFKIVALYNVVFKYTRTLCKV